MNSVSSKKNKFYLLLDYFGKVKPANFFLFAAIAFQVLYCLVTPPFQAPDERNHFFRAYRIAEGSFLPEKTDFRLGGEIPTSFDEFILPFNNASTNFEYKINRSDVFNAFKIKPSAEKEFQDFPNTSYYSPVSYIPQAIAIYVFKKANCSFGTMYYGGRFFVFFIWLISMFFVIKTLPGYKWLFTVLILMPMNLFITNSFSADTVTVILSFLFLSVLLKLTFSNQKIDKKNALMIVTIIGFLALAKVVYVGLVILLFIIPKDNFNSSKQRFLGIGFVFLFAFFIVWIWSGIVMENYISYKDYNPEYREISSLTKEANYYAQKSYILNNGFYFFKVISNSLLNHPQTYLLSYIGCFGTYLDIPLPIWICFLAYAFIIIVSINERSKFLFSRFQKTIIFLAALFTLCLILLSQHLTWDAVGKGIVDLLQGRYLIPILPLIFIFFNNKFLRIKFNLNFLVILMVVFLNLFSVKIIHERFFKEVFSEKIEFSCDAESLTKAGQFITSNPNLIVECGNCQSSDEHKSGKYSAKLTEESPYCFTYSFKNLNFGDLVEISAWQKGSGLQIVIAGTGINCDEFYFSNNSALFTDKNGWSKMQLFFTMPKKCNGSNVSFFVRNPSKSKVYVDDVKFCIKKFE